MKKHRSLIISAIGMFTAYVVGIVISSLLGVRYIASEKTIAWTGLISISFDPIWTIGVIIAIIWFTGYVSGRLIQYFNTKTPE